MVIAFIGVAILTGILLIRLHLYQSEIKHINEQLKFFAQNDTDGRLLTDFSSRRIRYLATEINDVIDKYRKLEQEAGRKERAIKEDFTNLSHDIRTPLTAISGYFQILKTTSDLEERERYIKIIDERIASLKSILESIFMYSKLENQSYDFPMYEFDFREIVVTQTLSFYQEMKEKKIETELNYTEECIRIRGNEDVYGRIIQNIIRNAIEHGNGSVKLSLEKGNNAVSFTCTNNVAVGYNLDIEKVFERFYKGDPNRTHTSSGLGLSISKKLAEKCGAKVSAWIDDDGEFNISLKI